MRPLSSVFACLLAVPSTAQVVGEAAKGTSATSSAGAAVSVVPGGLSAPALTPSVSLLSPAATPAPGAPAPALTPSLIQPVDLKSLPAKGKDYTPAEWGKLVAGAKDEGTRAVLDSKPGDNPSDPRLAVTLANGERVEGAFRGLADGKMIFQAGDKLVGLSLDAGGIAEVRRQVDVVFDGSTIRPAEVVVHSRAPVADPFKDLAKLEGRVVDIDMRDLDDLKWSAQTVSGRIVKADGDEIELKGEKGSYHLSREFHRVDKVALRGEAYSSKGKIATIADVAGKVPEGGAVEVTAVGGAKTAGRFFGVRQDAEGPYVLIEVPASGGTRFRAFRDFYDLRSIPGAPQVVYTAPGN